ncbi:LytR/AlgR family response regulator transcription factor [Portibacter marinus]|uniref:LytR/AlgR family response regulator transcription factor n=1 Tax=Portibacter marinus TaxID=2898660 RepID=UPI001F22AF4E|nr:LytTR family DNA-binding domain-containing protein [Portibacter marinus]
MESKLTAIAVDDEEHCLETLRWELERSCPQVDLVATASDELEARRLIKRNHFDLLFMDIHLQSASGIEMVKELQPLDGDVIFVTAYDQYALQAFEAEATNYLLKPISRDQLRRTIERIELQRQRQAKASAEMIVNAMSKLSINKRRIPINVHASIEFVDPSEIVYVKGDSNYSTLYFTSGEKLIVSKTLGTVEELLADYAFYRTHKSYLANLQHVIRYVKTNGGYLEMKGGHNVAVSRAKKTNIQEIFKSHQ